MASKKRPEVPKEEVVVWGARRWEGRLAPIQRERGNTVLFIGELAIAVGLCYLGYEIGDKAEKLADRIDKTNTILEQVSNSIAAISKDIHEVVELIKKLPEAIGGVIDANTLKQAMAIGASAAASLTDYMQNPSYFSSHRVEVMQQLQRVQDSVYVFQQFQGVSSVLHTAPLVGIWMQAQANLQRLFIEEGSPSINPFKSGMHRATVSMWKSVFSSMRAYDAEWASEWARLPRVQQTFKLETSSPFPRWVSSAVPYAVGYSPKVPDRSNLFSVAQSAPGQPAELHSTAWRTGSVFPIPQWTWCDILTPLPYGYEKWKDAARIHLAKTLWTRDAELFVRLSAFYAQFDGIDEAERKITEGVYSVPPDWQDSRP